MKIYNKFIGAFLVPGLLLALASCDDKNVNEGYQPQPVTGNIAYFPSNVSTTFEVSTDQDYVDVPIYRGSDEGTLTIELSIVPVEGAELVGSTPFTYDNSVTFQDGEKVAYLKVYYDISQLQYNDSMQFEISIDEDYTTAYGLNSEVITITYPEPWLYIGDGYYYDAMFGETEDDPYAVISSFFQNELDKTRFRIANPYYPINEEETYFEFQILQPGQVINGTEITLENLVYFDITDVTYIDSFEGIISLVWPGDLVDFGLTQFASEDSWTHSYVAAYQEPDDKGDSLPGEIRLAPLYLCLDSGIWAGDTSSEENVRIIFPGYNPMDLTLNVAYDGILINSDTYVLADVTLGEDMQSAKVGVAYGTDTASIAKGIEDGSIESVEITTSDNVRIPFSGTEEGRYSIVAVGYYDGQVVSTASATFTFEGIGGNNNWEDVGYVTYRDAFICAIYATYEYGGCEPYQVLMQQNKEKPGYYRLVNPYGQNSQYPLASQMTYESSANSYLYIDAQDPDKVSIPYCPQTVMPDPGYGAIECFGLTTYFLEIGEATEEDLYNYGYYGKLANGQITFNAQTLGIADNAGMYYANVATYADGTFVTVDGKTWGPFLVDMNSITTSAQAASFLNTRTVVDLQRKANKMALRNLTGNKYFKLHAKKADFTFNRK